MSLKVVVTGIGLVSALGPLEMTWKRLLSGEAAIRLLQPFPELTPLPLALIGNSPADFIALIQQVVADALLDADLSLPLPDCGVALGSSRGQQAKLEQLAKARFPTKLTENFSKPTTIAHSQFLNFLPHVGALAAAHQIGSTGPVLAPMAACSTGIWAIAQGMELIQTGQCQRVIAGAVEAPITPLTLAGFNQMGALAKTGSYPFDRQREGFVLGEGGALLVLESAELAKRRGAKIYGQVLGVGLTNDASSATSPDLGGKSGLTAIKQCLDRSHLSSHQIDYIHAHGTGTQLNDQHEALLIQSLFPQGIAVSSTKGATGHTLGASGALGAALCLMSLKNQLLPPCVGLKESDFELNLIKVASLAAVRNILCLSFGFGGQNAAVAFRRCE